jgi:hypothetical protein
LVLSSAGFYRKRRNFVRIPYQGKASAMPESIPKDIFFFALCRTCG